MSSAPKLARSGASDHRSSAGQNRRSRQYPSGLKRGFGT